MRALLLSLFCLLSCPAWAVECEDIRHLDKSFTVCRVDVTTENLRLFHSNAVGEVYGHFSRLEEDHGPLAFATNAGMYHDDRSPVGLYVEDGEQVMRLITSDGPGNFGLLPNGVLCLNEQDAQVIESLTFEATAPACRDATQSGPMLVIDGALHPRFLPDGTSRFIRNGVGALDGGSTAVFAISNEPVTFFEFGTLFRDILKTPNALYFDGNVSRLHAPQLDRSDPGFALGPMIAVVN